MRDDDILDCLIVGGGPAGLTAALYLARFRRRVRLVDSGASRARWIPTSHNLPGFPEGMHGEDLIGALTRQAGAYGVTVEPLFLKALERRGEGFAATLADGPATFATVLLATGVVETVPPNPGMAEAIKQGIVRVCPICDGYEARGRKVGVLGDGDHAAREALFLRTYARDVTLLLTGDCALDPAVADELAQAEVRVVRTELGAVRVGTDGVSAAGGKLDLLYSAFGVTPQAKLAHALGVALDGDGRIKVGERQETSVPGVFAAGDVVRGLNQIAVAEGEGAIAASAIHNRLPRNPRER